MVQKHAQQVIEFCPFIQVGSLGTSIEVITVVAQIQYLNGLSKISPKFCESCTLISAQVLVMGQVETSAERKDRHIMCISCRLMNFQ